MDYIAIFFAGAFLCNSLPHLARGLSGAPFPTPFAKPHGVGNSSPLVNFLWGAANFFVGLYLLQRHPVSVGLGVDFLVLTGRGAGRGYVFIGALRPGSWDGAS